MRSSKTGGLVLRDYQRKLVQDIKRKFEQGHKRVLAVLATGGGKTACFVRVAQLRAEQGDTVWFLVHRLELLDQAYESFERFNVPLDNIHIAMIGQTEDLPSPDLIVFDEGHHAVANTWRDVIERYPDVPMIGLTATPVRLDGAPLSDIYDAMVIGPDTKQLTEWGYLSPFKYLSVGLNDIGDTFDRKIYDSLIRAYQEHADGLQAIVFASSVEHSKQIALAFLKHGIPAHHIDGTTGDQERRETIQRFRSGRLKVISNVDLISEGFDLDACECVIMARPTDSLSLYLQQVGRSLRPKAGKTAIILDHVGNYIKHGLPDQQRDWSLTYGVSKSKRFNPDGSFSVRECPICFSCFESSLDECPICGTPYSYKRDEIQMMRNVKLQEIKKAEQKRKDDYRQRRYEAVETEADCRTYQDFYLLGKKRELDDPRRFAIRQSKRRGIKLPWERKGRRY